MKKAVPVAANELLDVSDAEDEAAIERVNPR